MRFEELGITNTWVRESAIGHTGGRVAYKLLLQCLKRLWPRLVEWGVGVTLPE